MIKKTRNEIGSVLIVALIAILVLAGFGFALWFRSNVGTRTTGDAVRKNFVQTCGESAVNLTARNLRNMLADRDIDSIFQSPMFGDPPQPVSYNFISPPQDYNHLNSDHRAAYEASIRNQNSQLPNIIMDQVVGHHFDKYELSLGYDKIDANKCKPDILWISKVDSPQNNLTIYRIITEAKAVKGDSKVIYESTYAASTNDSVFSYLKFSNYTIPIGPWPLGRNTTYKLKGKIHTNEELIAAAYGDNNLAQPWGFVGFEPLSFEGSKPFITTSGNVWEAFKYSWDMCSDPNVNSCPSENLTLEHFIAGPVKLRIEDNPWDASIPLVDHDKFPGGWPSQVNPPSYPPGMDDPNWGDMYMYPGFPPLRDNGVRLYGAKAQSYDIDSWQAKVLMQQPRKEVPIVQQLASYSPPIDPYELLKPPVTGGQPLLENAKFANQAGLRIDVGDDHTIRVYFPDGSLVPPGHPLHYTSLRGRGIIDKNASTYLAPAGQKMQAQVIDMNKLSTDSALIEAGINSIYIGNEKPRWGKIQYPAPGIPEGHTVNDARHRVCLYEGVPYPNPCTPLNIGAVKTVMIKNAQTLGRDFTIATNFTTIIQGDTNIDNPKSFGIFADSALFVSKDFQINNWHIDNVQGPNDVYNDMTVNVALMTGKILPFIENWKNPTTGEQMTLNQFGSEVYIWKSNLFPVESRRTYGEPRVITLYDWAAKMWVNNPDCINGPEPCYYQPRWNYTQDLRYATNPPPLSIAGPSQGDFGFIAILSVRELDKFQDYKKDPYGTSSQGQGGSEEGDGQEGGGMQADPGGGSSPQEAPMMMIQD